jgi:V-type H+-transporting ATPase proteolipid subunit
MSGIIAVYGLVISVLIAGDVNPAQSQSLYKYVRKAGRGARVWPRTGTADYLGNRGFMHLAAGLSVGLSGVAAGYTIGIVGDAVWIPIPRALRKYPALI